MSHGISSSPPAAAQNDVRNDVETDASIDVTGEVCPMTFVRTRLALDRLPAGGVLAVRLKGEEPRRNVAASAAALGHAVTVEALPDGTTRLVIRKCG